MSTPGNGTSTPAATGITVRPHSTEGTAPGPDAKTPRSSRAADKRAAAEKERMVPRPETLVKQLISAAGPGCSRRIEVPLTATATAVAMLGSGPMLLQAFLTHLATQEPKRALDDLRAFWDQMEASAPFLSGHLAALIGWIYEDVAPATSADERQRDRLLEDMEAFQRCVAVLAKTDFHQVVAQPLVEGELLGPVYTLLRSSGSQKANGAFFTPMHVCMLLATLTSMGEGESFAEPCSGAGAMAIAAAKEMRSRGLDPTTVDYLLNDIDPVAVSVTGINAVVHGLGLNVTLRCGDGLTMGLPATQGPPSS